MTEKLVDTKQTVVTMTSFAAAVLAAWPDVEKDQAGVLYAHFAGETGSGAHCYNYNLGNHKHVKGDGYDYVSLTGVWEGFLVKDEDGDGDIDADDRILLQNRLIRTGMWKIDPNPSHQVAVGKSKVSLVATGSNSTTWFRAYPSLVSGMNIFIATKRPILPSEFDPNPRQPRYSPAWRFILVGDPEGYARAIGALGYYTASPDVYARALRGRFDEWMRSYAFEASQASALETGNYDESSDAGEDTVVDFSLVHYSPYAEHEDLDIQNDSG